MKNPRIQKFRNIAVNQTRLPFVLFIISVLLMIACLLDFIQTGRMEDTIRPDVGVADLLYLFGYFVSSCFFWRWTFHN
jgi:hypothetical protein